MSIISHLAIHRHPGLLFSPVDGLKPHPPLFVINQNDSFTVDLISSILYSLCVEEVLDWEDDNDPSMEFWSSIKGGLKEKVQLL